MLLAAPYLLLANYCLTAFEDGGPGWLNLVVLVALWNTLKFIWIGPISVVLLIRVRIQVAVARGREHKQLRAAAADAELVGAAAP